jgi:hypothetical protein
MKNALIFVLHGASVGVVVIVTSYFLLYATSAAAQTGPDAVFNSSGSCSVSSKCTPSPAFIDASVFATGTTSNFCGVVRLALQSASFVPGGVIDARGLPGSSGISMTCPSTQPSPWYGISSPPALDDPAAGHRRRHECRSDRYPVGLGSASQHPPHRGG